MEYVRELAYVVDRVEQALDLRLLAEVPYCTHDWFSLVYVFQPTETAVCVSVSRGVFHIAGLSAKARTGWAGDRKTLLVRGGEVVRDSREVVRQRACAQRRQRFEQTERGDHCAN